jgi:cytoskeletal protein CcmA (bactofilin family)
VFGRTSTPEPVSTKPASAPSSNSLGNMTSMSAMPAPSQPGRASPFAPAATMGASVIGTDLTILGEKITIISQNRLQIDGDVRGDVNGRQVVIGEDGSVIGTVSAEAIEVRGGVRGAIKAQSVTLQPTAVVEGDIYHITLSIAEGAQFDGRVKRAKDQNELKPNLDVETLSPSNGASGPASSSSGFTG